MPTAKIHNIPPKKLKSIMVSAIREFSQHGYEQASFNRIITNAGISKGSMYYYFESKEDLFLLLLKNCIKSLEEKLKPTQELDTAASFWQEAEQLLGHVLKYFLSDPALGRFLSKVTTSLDQNNGAPTQTLTVKLNTWLTSFIQKGQELGAIRSDMPTEFILAMSWNIWRTGITWLFEGELSPPAKDPLAQPREAVILADLFKRVLAI